MDCQPKADSLGQSRPPRPPFGVLPPIFGKIGKNKLCMAINLHWNWEIYLQGRETYLWKETPTKPGWHAPRPWKPHQLDKCWSQDWWFYFLSFYLSPTLSHLIHPTLYSKSTTVCLCCKGLTPEKSHYAATPDSCTSPKELWWLSIICSKTKKVKTEKWGGNMFCLCWPWGRDMRFISLNAYVRIFFPEYLNLYSKGCTKWK